MHYLNEVTHTKYLDMLIDKRLRWSRHIDYITPKGANQVLTFLQRNLLKMNCYRTFVYPIAPQSGRCTHCATSIELKLFKSMPLDLCLMSFPIILV